MATIKQKRAVKIIIGEKVGSTGEALVKAGYTKMVAKTPQKVTESKGFIEEARPIVEQLMRERQRAIDHLKRTIDKAKYRDLSDSIDKLTKNIQLLSGKATENQAIQVQMVDWSKADESPL